MTFARKSLYSLNSLVLASLLSAAGASAMAQGAATAPSAAPPVAGHPAGLQGDRMGRHDPAKMQAWMARRQAEMKATLKITPAQEGAWTSFTAAMQPPTHMASPGGARATPEQRAEFDQLTTPQRIDKMRDMRVQRMSERAAAMDKHGEAIKAFYAALTPEQQKVFDTEHLKHWRRDGGHHEGMGHRKG